jgi:hypothetical protein
VRRASRPPIEGEQSVSTKYALPCNACGKKLHVQASQAGTSLKCVCGKSVDVPSMRGIRQLKQVDETAANKRRTAESGWGGRQATMLVCLIVGIPAVAYAVYLVVAPPKTPAVVAEELLEPIIANIESTGKTLSLDDSFKWWGEIQRDGISVRIPLPQKLTAAREQSRVYRFRLWLAAAIAGVSLVAAAAIFLLPRQQARS